VRWPFLYDWPMRRVQIIDWYRAGGEEVPGKSACSFCPWRNLDEWRVLRDAEPAAFDEACRVDELIRRDGPMRGMKALQYVHRSLRPLREVVDDETLLGTDQIDLFANECSGICGV